jgi:uncharacterized membrane protein YeaQ/YmgE (transglycosylase-associated protein family)
MLLAPIVWVIIGLIAGWAAGKIMKGSGYGVVVDIILGIVGAVVGGWLMGLLGIYSGNLIGTTIIAIIGAMFLIWLSRLIKKT